MTINTNRPLRGFRYVQTQFGDTLQAVAARELGDVSKWPSLIYINGLTFPYLTDNEDDSSPTVILNGGTIIVPSASSLVPLASTAETALGTDMALAAGVLSDDGMGDFATVSGSANYSQAIANAINTPRGQMLWYASYGCNVRALIGRMNGPTVGLLAKSYVAATILSDPRTISVGAITVTISGATVAVVGNAVTVNGSLDFQVNQ